MKRILVALALVTSVIGSTAGVVTIATLTYSPPALADCDPSPCP